MNTPVKLSDIVDALLIQNDEISCYLNRVTGEVAMFSSEELSAAEEGDDLAVYPDWQRELIELARQIVTDETGQFLELPTQFEVHEYQIMERFCLTIKDPRTSDELYYAIKGRGAFRRFKEAIHRFGIADDWYRYRDETLKEMAIAWCQRNGISYV